MKARYRKLLEHSIDMMLGAMEIYNKPNFPSREQVFSVLAINAWESLAKAKILKDNRNKMTSLYVKDGRHYKKSRRTGAKLTIDFVTAIDRCNLPEVVARNLLHLYDVRNAAIHLTSASDGLPLLVFTLGSASLSNYARLINKWFGIGLGHYDFHILPLGFSYPFSSLSAIELSNEPSEIAGIIKAVSEEESKVEESEGYFLTCQIQIKLIAAGKSMGAEDAVVRVDKEAETPIVVKDEALLDRYPYTFTEALTKLVAANPNVRRNDLTDFIKNNSIKGDSRYSAYNFRSKRERSRGPSSATAVLYNEDFIRLFLSMRK